jgi:uncharacterized MnhB-related membrane protein
MDLLTLTHLIILGFLIATALAAVMARDLLAAVIIYSAYSFTMAITYLILRSPDVAMTEAAVGAGVTSILFVAALSRTKRKEE